MARPHSVTRREIATEIEIDATPAQVWAVLADTATYSEWNPFIVALRGELTENSVIEFKFAMSPAPPLPGRARVLKVVGERELRWAGNALADWLFRAEHYHLLTVSSGGATRLQHGELFSGLLAAPLWPLLQRFGRPAYLRFNEALRRRAAVAATYT
jgi:hypothetical protein